MVAAGLVSLVIANYLYNAEHRALLDYLRLKIQQFREEHRRNQQCIPPPSQLETV